MPSPAVGRKPMMNTMSPAHADGSDGAKTQSHCLKLQQNTQITLLVFSLLIAATITVLIGANA